jgi:CheY-like chemotaxis protein
MAHSHREQEEAYIVVSGSGRIRLDDEIHELRQWDVVRIAPATVRVLVDDEQPLRLLYRTNLEWAGFTVVEAEDGPTAIDVAAKTQPEVALLDILLPDMSGWSIAAELARSEKTAQTAIVFLSALTPHAEKLRELERVDIPYLEKPLLDPTQLPELLSEAIEAERPVDRDRRIQVLEQLASS